MNEGGVERVVESWCEDFEGVYRAPSGDAAVFMNENVCRTDAPAGGYVTRVQLPVRAILKGFTAMFLFG